MRAYKHMAWKYAQGFRRGTSIQVGTFAFYREMEGNRGDAMEGALHLNIEELVLEKGVEVPHNLKNRGFGEITSGTIQFQNCTVVEILPPAFIFCASSAVNENEKNAGKLAFQINDLHEFAYLLSKKMPFAPDFHYGPVQYQPRCVNALDSKPVRADPFIKDTHFSWESEIRIVWPLPVDLTGEYNSNLILECPEIARLISSA